TELTPGQFRRIAFLQNLDALAVDDDGVVIVLDSSVEAAMRAVVLEQQRKRFGVGQIVDRHNIKLAGAGSHDAKHETTNPPKTVDSNSNSHEKSPNGKPNALHWRASQTARGRIELAGANCKL